MLPKCDLICNLHQLLYSTYPVSHQEVLVIYYSDSDSEAQFAFYCMQYSNYIIGNLNCTAVHSLSVESNIVINITLYYVTAIVFKFISTSINVHKHWHMPSKHCYHALRWLSFLWQVRWSTSWSIVTMVTYNTPIL